MNILDASKSGGHPLYLQDVDFLQKANREIFQGLTTAIGADSYILTGCDKTLQSAGVWAISEGFVVLDGEVFKVPAHTVTFLSESDPLYFKIQQQYVEPSPVLYKESGIQNVHVQRQAIISTESTGWDFSSIKKLNYILTSFLSSNKIITLEKNVLWEEGDMYAHVSNGIVSIYGSLATENIQGLSSICKMFDIPADLTMNFNAPDKIGFIPAGNVLYSTVLVANYLKFKFNRTVTYSMIGDHTVVQSSMNSIIDPVMNIDIFTNPIPRSLPLYVTLPIVSSITKRVTVDIPFGSFVYPLTY